uniref:C-type lectin domain-containing protein n=1 Tax=Amphilophus citrinellus TaxID=61819 RepID=A0A3Q0RHN5_AMPCI
MFTAKPGRCYRLVAVSLALLAVVLLMLNIGLGVHYNKLTDTHLTLNDTERISKELTDLQDTYKAAIETMKDARKQLDSETSRQTQTNWELEHQTKRSNDYKSQIETITKEIETMRSHLLMTSNGCKHCPAGWILMNSVCYYFSFSDNGYKTWKESRDFCQLHGGDLIIIDSKDEEVSSYFCAALIWVDRPIRRQNPSLMGFWIGLRDLHEEGTWKWWDGTFLDEGYWNDGEPNDIGNEDCAAVYPRENFFKAWNDVKCDAEMKWICEKAPTSMS